MSHHGFPPVGGELQVLFLPAVEGLPPEALRRPLQERVEAHGAPRRPVERVTVAVVQQDLSAQQGYTGGGGLALLGGSYYSATGLHWGGLALLGGSYYSARGLHWGGDLLYWGEVIIAQQGYTGGGGTCFIGGKLL